MSAIAGILRRSGPPDPEPVLRMLRAAPHRGARHEVFSHGRCALGISNVEGLEESSAGRFGPLTAAFTGTLDNLSDIVAELRPQAPSLDEASAAEVFAAAFAIAGPEAVNRCRGLFAAAVTDGERLWCVRDHLGMRTLFCRDDASGTVIATEAKQVVAGAGMAREPDLEVLERIVYGTYEDETPSALKGVRRLPKATILRADASGTALTRYWHPEALLETARVQWGELRERFEAVMRQAVARTLTGNDVISLSGGIDSPTVAAFAAEEHLRRTGRPLPALAAVYPDLPSVDESRYIEAVADYLNIALHTYRKHAEPLGRLAEWVRLLDGPVPKILVTDAEEHFEEVRRLGFRTMLTGEVAEFVVDMRGGLSAHLLVHGRLGPLWHRMKAQRARGASIAGIGWQTFSAFVPGSLEGAATRVRGRWGRPDIPPWIDARKVNHAAAQYLVPSRTRWRQQQLAGFMGPGLTMEANEIVQVLCGVRVRMPWADVDVWEFFLSLPAEIKFPDAVRKGLIRRLMRGKLPDVILDRMDKTVFRDSMLGRADYAAFRRWLIDPPYRIPGVDYALLADRLHQEKFTISEFVWAKDLAATHAFLSEW